MMRSLPPRNIQQRRGHTFMIKNSPLDDGDGDDVDVDPSTYATEHDTNRFVDDPDGIPLFDTNERQATLFGLEPNSDLDNPLDNGLQFTGPVILFLSVYATLSLFFADTDMAPPPLDVSM